MVYAPMGASLHSPVVDMALAFQVILALRPVPTLSHFFHVHDMLA